MTKQLKDKMGLWLFRYIWPYFREGKKNYMWDFQTVDDKGKELIRVYRGDFHFYVRQDDLGRLIKCLERIKKRL